MKTVFVLLLCVALVYGQTDMEKEEDCGCPLGPNGDAEPAFDCGYMCPSGYQCHILVKPCDPGYECLATNGVWGCVLTGPPPCVPDCANKRCGESDGCDGRCATGSCPMAKDTCGGGGIEFVCGRPKKNDNKGWAWGLIGGGLGATFCAGGIIYVKRRQRKTLIPADLKAPVEASAVVEVETDQGTSSNE